MTDDHRGHSRTSRWSRLNPFARNKTRTAPAPQQPQMQAAAGQELGSPPAAWFSGDEVVSAPASAPAAWEAAAPPVYEPAPPAGQPAYEPGPPPAPAAGPPEYTEIVPPVSPDATAPLPVIGSGSDGAAISPASEGGVPPAFVLPQPAGSASGWFPPGPAAPPGGAGPEGGAAGTAPVDAAPGGAIPADTVPTQAMEAQAIRSEAIPLAYPGWQPSPRETLADVAAAEAMARAEAATVTQTTTIADLARAHEEATVEHAIAREVDRRSGVKRKILLTVALALVGVMMGTAGALLALSQMKRTPPQSTAKVGIQSGLSSFVATTPAEATATAAPATATAAQIGVIITGLGDGSNETSANLAKFTAQRLPLTYAVLPQRPGTAGDAAAVQASSGQVILYQPIGGAGSSADGQRGAVSEGQTNRQFANMITRNTGGLSGCAGIMPFGFKKGRYPAKVLRLLPVMAMRENVLIAEPMTGTGFPLEAKAKALGVRYVVPDFSLDAKSGEKYFRQTWATALKRAEQKGKVVVECSLSGLSSRVLPSLLARLDTNKFQLTLVSAMP